MSYCLNINCQEKENKPEAKICKNCGSKLLLKNRYRSLKKIGQGGFGQTFLAVDEDLPSKPLCVIKQFIPPLNTANLEKAKTLFTQESIQLDQLGKHPQIPKLLAYFSQDHNLYLIQEYIEGQNLKQKLDHQGNFDQGEIIYLLKDLLPVIQFIHHHKIIHRDIKPENIISLEASFRQVNLPENSLLNQNNQYCLVDFGASKFATGTALVKTGTIIGTPQYVAPEQSLGKATFSSDLYSLGVTCLHLLTNMEPFDLFDISTHQWAWQDYLTQPINQDLVKILNQMIMMGTQYRYQSAEQILEDLTNLKSHLYILPQKLPKSQENCFIKQSNLADVLTPIQLGNKWGFQDSLGQIVTINLFDKVKPFKDNFAPVKIGDLWGFINREGKLVVSPKFTKIFPFKQGLAKVEINCKYGFINQDRQICIPVTFDEIKEFCQGLAPVKIGEQWGYINLEGKLVIPAQFDQAFCFSENLAPVQLGEQYGYINREGIFVILPQFSLAKPFLNNLAWVEQNGQGLLINSQGKIMAKVNPKMIIFAEKLAVIKVNQSWGYLAQDYTMIIPPIYEDARNFREKFAAVKIKDQWGFINQKNQIVIKPQFTEVGDFHEGKAPVKINNLWGYLNSEGKVIIEAQFEGAHSFKQGTALVKLANQYFYIDHQGKIISEKFEQVTKIKDNLAQVMIKNKLAYINQKGEFLSLLLEQIDEFSENLARVKVNNKYGFINEQGQVIISPIFDGAGNFCQGFARIKIKKKLINLVPIYEQWGYINEQGEIIIAPQFDYALDFCQGLAGVKIKDKWGYINMKGELVITPQFDEVSLFQENLAYVKINQKYGYINMKGEVIITPQFDEVTPFCQGVAQVNFNKWLSKIPFYKSWYTIDRSGKILDRLR